MPHRFKARPGFEANGVEVQLHVDMRMRQKAGSDTTKIKSAKSFVEVYPRKSIPLKYTRYAVGCRPYFIRPGIFFFFFFFFFSGKIIACKVVYTGEWASK